MSQSTFWQIQVLIVVCRISWKRSNPKDDSFANWFLPQIPLRNICLFWQVHASPSFGVFSRRVLSVFCKFNARTLVIAFMMATNATFHWELAKHRVSSKPSDCTLVNIFKKLALLTRHPVYFILLCLLLRSTCVPHRTCNSFRSGMEIGNYPMIQNSFSNCIQVIARSDEVALSYRPCFGSPN